MRLFRALILALAAAASGCAATPAPLPSIAGLVAHGDVGEACRRLRPIADPLAPDLGQQRDAREARRLVRRLVRVEISVEARPADAVNAALGGPILHGEVVPLAITATVSAPRVKLSSVDVGARHDGALWRSIVRDAGDPDAVRTVFSARVAPPVTPRGEPTVAGDLRHELDGTYAVEAPHESSFGKVTPASSLLDTDRACQLGASGTPCHALVPLARRSPSLGPDALLVDVELFLPNPAGEAAGGCTLTDTFVLPLPPGESLADRVTALFGGRSLQLAGPTEAFAGGNTRDALPATRGNGSAR